MAGNHLTARMFLAREIRLAREAKGISRAKFGKEVYASESLVAAWESGRHLPKPDVLERVEQRLGTGGILARMIDDLVRDEAAPEWMGKWLEIERQATSLVTFEPLLIPGLLQNEQYAREVIHRSGRQVHDLDERVQARLARQEILTGENPPMFVAVLDESVLYRPVGGPHVMYEQLTRIRDLTERPNVLIQVIPTEVGAHPGCAGPVVIATVEGREIAYVDDVLSGDVIEAPDDVALVKRVWETLRVEALPAKQSLAQVEKALALVEKAIEQWT